MTTFDTPDYIIEYLGLNPTQAQRTYLEKLLKDLKKLRTYDLDFLNVIIYSDRQKFICWYELCQKQKLKSCSICGKMSSIYNLQEKIHYCKPPTDTKPQTIGEYKLH